MDQVAGVVADDDVGSPAILRRVGTMCNRHIARLEQRERLVQILDDDARFEIAVHLQGVAALRRELRQRYRLVVLNELNDEATTLEHVGASTEPSVYAEGRRPMRRCTARTAISSFNGAPACAEVRDSAGACPRALLASTEPLAYAEGDRPLIQLSKVCTWSVGCFSSVYGGHAGSTDLIRPRP